MIVFGFGEVKLDITLECQVTLAPVLQGADHGIVLEVDILRDLEVGACDIVKTVNFYCQI